MPCPENLIRKIAMNNKLTDAIFEKKKQEKDKIIVTKNANLKIFTSSIFFPIMAGFDFGMGPERQVIWFAVIMLLAMEISFTTPPFGLLLFVMQGVCPPGTRFSEICMAAIPFMGCAIFLVIMIVIFPEIATWLPFITK